MNWKHEQFEQLRFKSQAEIDAVIDAVIGAVGSDTMLFRICLQRLAVTAGFAIELEQRLRALLKNAGHSPPLKCKGCGAAVVYVTHDNGRRPPYCWDGKFVGVNHFANCPHAQQFKRTAKGGE